MIALSCVVCSSLRDLRSACPPANLRKYVALLVQRLPLLLVLAASWSHVHAQQSPQVLHNHVHREVSAGQAPLLSPMPPDQQLNLSIVLPLRNTAELSSLLHRLYDPSSPDYRQFLSVAQFTEQFGPTVEDYQGVIAFAQSNGFTVGEIAPNRLVVPISGTVDQINKAFNVQMNIYQHPSENRTFFSPDREPSLNLSVPIEHISGLNDFSLPQPLLKQAPDGLQITNVTGSGPGASYLGSDMRAAYYGGTTLDGNGQALGVLEFDGYYLSDVDLTFANAGQSYRVPINNVLLDGVTGQPINSGGEAEVVLDIVQAIGMAPGLTQVRVYMGKTDASILNSMASENIAKELSCSWAWLPDDPSVADVFFQEFAAQGQSFFVASGDAGAFDAAISPYFFPADAAYITAVGGTHLETNGAGGTWASETAWNSLGAGSGGGISPDGIPIPSWQVGLANSSNGGSTTLRNVPDVAMEGDFDNYLCYLGYCFGGGAGTSFAAPRWAAFTALINQQAVEGGHAPKGGIGFINPSIYSIGTGTSYGTEFHDITSGNNDTQSQPVWYSAVAGYDLVTGWGSANGQNLIDDLAGPQKPGFWILASSSTVSINQGASTPTTITVTDAGGFSGKVTLTLTSVLPSGVTAKWGTNPTSGTSVLTLTATRSATPSTTNVTITGTSGALTAKTEITVAVHAPSFSLAASPVSVDLNQGATGQSTITVTPLYGFTGKVDLAVSGLPSGVIASWDTNPTSATSVLTLKASSSAPASTGNVTITGTSGTLTETTTLAVAVHTPSFTLSGGGSLDIGQGTSGTSYIYVNSLYGFTGNVNLSVSGLPAGVTASFSPNPTNGYSNLTITAASSAAVGSSTLTITGTSGSLTATTTLTLGIHAPTFTLSSSGSVSIGQGTTATSYIYVNSQYGFTGSVTLSVTGLPSGVTYLWNPNPTSQNSQLTLIASSTATTGSYTLTITGTSGNLTATTTLSLGVYVPTFTLSSFGNVTIGQGTTATSYVYVNPEYGFTGSVNLSVSGLPSGVTASFSPNPTTGSSTITLTATSTAAVGQYTLTVTGTSGKQTATTTITLGVYAPTFTLYGPGSFTLGQGTSATTYVSIYPQYGFTGSVTLSVSGLPSGVTASFSPNPTTGSSTMTLTASSTATLGQYTVTMKGTSGTQTATTTFSLGVFAPTFTLYGNGYMTMGQGTTATSYVYVNPEYGFTGNVTLSASGLPTGVTASFSPNPTNGSSTMTLTAASTAALGQYTVTIKGTSGTQTATTTLSLGIYVPTFSLYGPGNIDIGQGTSFTTSVYISPQYGFNSNVTLAASGLPSGVTASFSPNPAAANTTSILTLTATNAAPLGQYTVTITGTSGTQTASITFALGIYVQSFTIGASPNSLTMNDGTSSTVYLYVTPNYGFSGNVTLAASGLPTGVTASFSPNPTTYGSSTLTLTTSNAALSGTTNITISGTSGSLKASTTVALTVNAPTFTLQPAPSEISLLAGDSGKSVITVIPQYGFSGNVNLSVAGLPSGVTASFAPNPFASGSSSLMTLAAGNSATSGSSTATITGTSGAIAATAPLVVTVRTAPATTSTTLTVTSSGTSVNTVAAGAVVTLSAAVDAGSSPVKTGQVNFCDATATYCDQIHLLGSAQLTSAGTATLKFIPGMGTHSYKAVFAGTTSQASSASAASNLTVNASTPTTTTIAQSGNAGNYTLTGTVTGNGLLSPTGTVSFLDTSNGNLALGSAALGKAQTALSSVTSQSPTTGQSPRSIAIGDFNGDGIPDLAVTNAVSNTLTILLGNGDGTFTASASNPQTGNQPDFIAVGDFNNDGKADLAVANGGSNSLTILLGNGDGTFTATVLSPQTGNGPVWIAMADFNGDGIQDLAVANGLSNTVTVLLGNGDGTFTATTSSLPTGNNPESIVAGDFNGDGIPDLAVTNTYSGTVTIFLGNGDGTFVQSSNPASGPFPVAIAAGDFNGDGNQDLVVANQFGSFLTILLGNGDGTFTASSTSPQTGSNPVSIAVGDFNGDGKPDLATANFFSNSVTILLGNGDGTFTAANSPSTGNNPVSIVVGDVNGDGIADLAVVNATDGTATILTSQLAQTATLTMSGIAPVGQGSHLVVASYAGDSNYKSSVSGTTSLTATSASATVTVTTSSANINPDQALTVTVTVTGVSGKPAPTGSVDLTSGTYNQQQSLSNGSASFTIAGGTLSGGAITLTAAYSGDATYPAATGTASVTVANVVVAVTAPTPVSPGASTTGTVTLTADSAYSGTVNLQCKLTASPSGAQSLPTCTLNPASVTLTAGGNATTVFTVKTTAASTAFLLRPNRRNLWGLEYGGPVLAIAMMFGISSRRRRWISMFVLLFVIAVAGSVGCGGGGGGTTTGSGTPATTAGSYTFAVTATDTADAKITTSVNVNITVQ